MKKSLIALLFSAPLFAFAQQPSDPLAIKAFDSLLQVSTEFLKTRDLEQAIAAQPVLEKFIGENFGPKSLQFADAQFLRGKIAHVLEQDLEAAIVHYSEAQSLREQLLGDDHPDVAACLNNIGYAQLHMGDFVGAEGNLLHAKAIFKESGAKQLANLGIATNHLGILYFQMGHFEKAEQFYEEGRLLREKILGKHTPDYCGSLINLATARQSMGKYAEAESGLLEAKRIFEVEIGNTNHPYYANCLNNLAKTYNHLGNNDLAIELYRQVLEIREKSPGKAHQSYATCLQNLAIVYMDKGEPSKAQPLYIEALEILKNTVGEEHWLYALNLDNLANYYHEVGNFQTSDSLQKICLQLWEKTMGDDSPPFASSLENRANLWAITGKNPDTVAGMLQRVRSIREKSLGKMHPDYVKTLGNLAAHYERMGKPELAEPYFAESAATEKTLITAASKHLSESEYGQFLALFNKNQWNALDFAAKFGTHAPPVFGVCFDNALFYKGYLLSTANRMRRLAEDGHVSSDQFQSLKTCGLMLSQAYSLPIVERDSESVDRLEKQYNEIEKELAGTVFGYADALKQVKWEDVQAALQPDGAAIEFVHYRSGEPGGAENMMYAALILKKGDPQPAFVPLFEEKQLEALLKISGGLRSDFINDLYSFSKVPDQKKTLFDLIWQPIEGHLTGIKTIHFSPSGLLHRLNIAAIPASKEACLINRFNMVQLKSTRQLALPDEQNFSGRSAMLFGGINFDPPGEANAQPPNRGNAPRGGGFGPAVPDLGLRADYPNLPYDQETTRKPRFFHKKQSKTDNRGGGAWGFLPGTEREVNALETLLTTAGIAVTTKKGHEATEAFFKAFSKGSPSPRIMHIATHGYFFPDAKPSTTASQEPVFKTSEQPMLRSGLILAGGNAAWARDLRNEPTKLGMEDGILTAYEISQMDLSNSELVVLSACETGLGDIKGNEGVYGLQRAFKIAGAKYIIMSLWQVPDRQTTDLMTAFYKKWLLENMPVPDAFRAAQKEMREKYQHPYFWAGFVLVE